MKFAWKWFVGWVVWRRTLPAAVTAAEREVLSMQLMNSQLRLRLEMAERRPNWKEEYEREVAFNKEAGRRYAALLERYSALESGMTASGLSPAEVERLALLTMAAGKLAAEASKVILYGWGSPSPTTGRPAYSDVEHGMGRVKASIELMTDAGDVRRGDVRAHAGRAKQRIGEQATRQ